MFRKPLRDDVLTLNKGATSAMDGRGIVQGCTMEPIVDSQHSVFTRIDLRFSPSLGMYLKLRYNTQMGKRKLTSQQKRRVKDLHAKRIELSINEAALGAEQTGLVVARHGATVEVEDDNQKIHLCNIRQNIYSLVPGDKVIWRPAENNTGIVAAQLPRTTVLNRPDFHGHPKPIAANVSQMIIVFAPKPEPSADLINKYLVAAALLQVRPVIVLNKTDLLTKQDVIHQWIDIYNSLNYSVICTNQTDPDSIIPLQDLLKEQVSIILGQSGVGKSSLVRLLLPDTDIKVGDISKATGFGKHTTSTARLYHIPSGGDLIDSPGVRNFTLWNITYQELLSGFAECRSLIGQCKFRDCHHQHEPGCVVKELFDKQGISPMRYQSLLHIMQNLG